MKPNDLRDQSYDIGKCAVFYTDTPWDGTTNLFASDGPLKYLSAMQGAVKFAANPEYSNLTLPEALGPGILKRYINGTAPSATFGLYPTPELAAAIGPTGVASLGQEMQRLALAHTLWVVPERLFLGQDANGFPTKVEVVLNAGVWEKDGVALTAEEQRLLDTSLVIWKADFQPLTDNFQWEDGGRNLTEVEVTAQVDLTKPQGCNQVLKLSEAFDEYGPFTGLIDFEPV